MVIAELEAVKFLAVNECKCVYRRIAVDLYLCLPAGFAKVMCNFALGQYSYIPF